MTVRTTMDASDTVMDDRPNVVFIMADDHSAGALSCYGSVINRTPNLDRLAAAGARLDSAFCTNAICSPSRASFLTGTYSHLNGVTTLKTEWDARQPTFVSHMHDAGYQTALVGKWHLGHGGIHDPKSFDYWEVLPAKGRTTIRHSCARVPARRAKDMSPTSSRSCL
jgi:arylsulfatase A-like enzyme